MKSCTRGDSNHPPPTCEGTPFPFNATTLRETCLERMEHSSGQFDFGFEYAFAPEKIVGLRAAHEVSSGPLPRLIWCGCWRSCIVSSMFARLFLKGAQVMCLIVRHPYVSVASCVSTLVLIRGFPGVGHARRCDWVLRPRCLVVQPRWKCQLHPHVCGHRGTWTV